MDGRRQAQTDRGTGGCPRASRVRRGASEAVLARGCGASRAGRGPRRPLGLSFSRTLALGQGTRGDPASSALPPGPAGTAPPGSKEGGGRCGKVINRRRGKGRKYLEDSGDTLSAPTN